jgi:hypothetical protein
MENRDRTSNEGGREGQGGGQQRPGGGGQTPGGGQQRPGGGQQQPGGGQKQGGYQSPGQSPDQGERDKTRRSSGRLNEGEEGLDEGQLGESDGDEDNEFEPGTIRKPSEDESERIQRTYQNPNQRQVRPSEDDSPNAA